MSYANMDGVPTQTAGTSEILASDWNTYVRDNFDSIKFGHIVCESTSRPTGIAEGTMIYETDTNKVLVYSGSSWIEINDLDRAGGLPETSPGHLIVANNAAKSALSATEGMMVYQSDNNKVFVYDGSDWVSLADTDVPGGLDFIARITFSGASSASFANNVFTSDYDAYKLYVSITGVSTNNGLFMRLRSSGADVSSGIYHSAVYQVYAGGSDLASINRQDAATSWALFQNDTTYTPNLRSTFDILGPNLAVRTVYGGMWHNPINPKAYHGFRIGSIEDTNARDSMTLLPDTGTITGNATLYGYRGVRV